MQAIILAAGMGRRLGEYTRDNTKCMVPVNGIKLIDRLLTQLARLDLRRVVIVLGYKGDNLRQYLGDNYHGQLPIEYVENPIYDRTNNIYSLALAKHKLQDDDTLLVESDLIFDDTFFPRIVACPHPNVALVAKYEPWMDGTMVRIDADDNIVSFVPRKAFDYAEVDNYYKTVNIYKFSREFLHDVYVPFLDAYSQVMGNNDYYEQVLRVITSLDRVEMKALTVGDARWYEIDDAQDLDIASTIFADEHERLPMYARRYGGYWRFPKLLDFCYLVNPFFPPQRLRDEIRANFDNLLTQYPSGMWVNSLLAGKYFGIKQDHVVVGNGAAELIKSLMQCNAGRVGVVYPTFEEYPNRLDRDSIERFVPQNADLRYTVDDLMTHFDGRNIQCLLLINPDNPSGNFIPVADVLRLEAWCAEREIRLVVDESFVDFTDEWATNSLLHNDILTAHPMMVVVKSISKSYGVPGLRLGVMASADTDFIAWMKRDVAIWNINSMAEFYLQIFNKYESVYREACAKFVVERRRFAQRLAEVPWLRVIPSQANYFLCEITGSITSTQLTEQLLNRHNILIKDCNTKNALQGRNMVRIAIRGMRDNDLLVEALKSIEV
ncbi:MAG: aminotransferase class I/II-fold pyridoxal phosphate-dependent enzyme [Muribaculaceae bacterium]|nr:aminotransferase class I/II-fold pyridoxal phosphate-dependent enzyme [Muribaculaceae bacterium]